MVPRAGEIYLEGVGAEKKRPCVVVSRGNQNRGDYVVIVPITSRKFVERSQYANCVVFREGDFGLDTDCVAQAEHVHAALKSYLDLNGGPLGTLDGERIREMIRAIGYVISADCEPVG